MPKPRSATLANVRVEPTDLSGYPAELRPKQPVFTVTPVWEGVDRPDSYSWGMLPRRLAIRLAAAFTDGAFTGVILTDVNGRTYVNGDNWPSGRYMSSDLRQLGY
jgi:hypothetical protein